MNRRQWQWLTDGTITWFHTLRRHNSTEQRGLTSLCKEMGIRGTSSNDLAARGRCTDGAAVHTCSVPGYLPSQATRGPEGSRWSTRLGSCDHVVCFRASPHHVYRLRHVGFGSRARSLCKRYKEARLYLLLLPKYLYLIPAACG